MPGRWVNGSAPCGVPGSRAGARLPRSGLAAESRLRGSVRGRSPDKYGETFDLASLTELGTEDQHYRIESQETDELFPGDQPVVIYRCHSDQRAMVKVGFSPEGQDWRSVLIALPEKMDPDAFDFSSAMGGEVTWLVERGAIAGLDLERVPAMVEGLVPGSRFFTGEATLAGQNCVTPHTCTRCGGDAVFTELPPEPLAIETAVDLEDWGGFKARFRDAATR